MSSLRRVCIVASAAPVVLLSCVDLAGLSDTKGAGDAEAIDAALPPSGMKCPPGQKSCAGGCVATDLPEYGCGTTSCDRCALPFADTQTCVSGACAVGTCQPGRGDCDLKNANGCEADLTTGATCGSCKVACPTMNPLCSLGNCVASCGLGETLCAGSACVNTQTSPLHCGGCGNACPGATNASPSCAAAQCGVKCNTGFGDCDGTPSNGCEPLKPYYADSDGDGFGAGVKAGEACTPPAGASLAAGDCLDTNPQVKPGQASFFFVGYTNATGNLSYDYDCNSTEEREPTKTIGPGCGACRVGDFTAIARPNAPAVADFYCGSTTRITQCGSSSGGCLLQSISGTMGCR